MNYIKGLSIAIIIYILALSVLDMVYKNLRLYITRLNSIEEQSSGSMANKKKKLDLEKKGVPFLEKLQEDLILAELKLRANEFVVIWLISAIVPSFLVLLITRNPIFFLGLFIVGALIPKIVLGKLKNKNRELFNEQLGEAIMIISNSLRAGFTFEQALKSVSRDLPNPIGREFRKIVQESELGESLENVMENVSSRMASDDMELMNTAVVIQRQVGGNLADVLDNIGKTIRMRGIMKRNIKALTAQGEVSGKVIAILPVFLLVVLTLISYDYMSSLYTTSFGQMALGLSVVLEILGYAVIKKIINIDI